MSDKKFGLIIPKKADKFKMKVSSVFGDESDEDEIKSNRPIIPQKKIQSKSKIKQETLEDPSIYEYDSIYDEMKAKEAESITPKEKKNSRYIETLLKAADKRKKEYERRIDKKIQAERENEGDMYKDKEAFVTSSYKKKLQEKEEEEERERRENMLNDMMDITKQKDLSGFYRHFLKQTVGEEKIPVYGARNIKKEVTSCENSPKKDSDNDDPKKQDLANIDQDSDGVEIDSESDASDPKYKKSTVAGDISGKDDDKEENLKRKTNRNDDLSDKSKHFLQRKKLKTHHRRVRNTSSSNSSSSDNEDFVSNEKDPHSSGKPTSHHSRHDPSSGSDKVNKTKLKESSKKDKYINASANIKPSINTNCSSTSDSEADVIDISMNKKSSNSNKKSYKNRSRHDSSSSNDDSNEKESHKETEENEVAKKSKSKENIFTKRTVGEVFISAQARYFQRMALKA